MAISLGSNQYGKAGTHVVRIYRDTDRHEIRDLTVGSALRGDFSAAHDTGDQSDVLPTDTQKNTAFAFAKEKGIDSPEQFCTDLARHFLTAAPVATGARVEAREDAWARIQDHDHAFTQTGGGTRTTVVNLDGRGDDEVVHVVSGISDLVVLKSTGSEFKGFLKDKYTTLQETTDRVLATSLVARWRYESGQEIDYNATYDAVLELMLKRFSEIHSLALQQTLFGMGKSVLEEFPQIAEIKFSAPNKHHFLVDFSAFGIENNNEVFYAADRPFGLIEANVVRDDSSDAGNAWHGIPGFC